MKSTICIAEDRATSEPSLKLLLLSLDAHSPGISINLFYPPATDKFTTWLENIPQVTLQTSPLKRGYGWNVKPEAIMRLIDQGFEDVVWIDSDVIVNRDIAPIFSGLQNNVVVATEHTLSEERGDRNGRRARLWGLRVGRVLPYALNSGVVRVTKHHSRLIGRWWDLLQSTDYQECQQKPWHERPLHMAGDQDVLTALLTSEEFSQIPIHILRRGKEIIQFNGVYGYTIRERMVNMLGTRAAFVHSCTAKPWSESWRLDGARFVKEYVKKVYLDVSPYTISALSFRRKLGCDTQWMEPHFALSRAMRRLGRGYAPIVGLPVALFADVARIAKYLRIISPTETFFPGNRSGGDSGMNPFSTGRPGRIKHTARRS